MKDNEEIMQGGCACLEPLATGQADHGHGFAWCSTAATNCHTRSGWEKQLLQAQGLVLSCFKDDEKPADGIVHLPGAAALGECGLWPPE